MKKLLVLSSCLLFLFTACEPPEYPTLVSGTLYTDSTLSTPVANDTVWFCDINRADGYLGHATTDSLGRFGFSFWNFDVTQTEYVRRKGIYYHFIALYGQDTLLQGRYRDEYKRLILFPGRQWRINL